MVLVVLVAVVVLVAALFALSVPPFPSCVALAAIAIVEKSTRKEKVNIISLSVLGTEGFGTIILFILSSTRKTILSL